MRHTQTEAMAIISGCVSELRRADPPAGVVVVSPEVASCIKGGRAILDEWHTLHAPPAAPRKAARGRAKAKRKPKPQQKRPAKPRKPRARSRK